MLARSLIRLANRMLSTRGRTPEMHAVCLHVYISSQSGSREQIHIEKVRVTVPSRGRYGLEGPRSQWSLKYLAT